MSGLSVGYLSRLRTSSTHVHPLQCAHYALGTPAA